MRPVTGLLAAIVVLSLADCSGPPTSGPGSSRAAVGPHGGRITVTRDFRFETVFRTTGVLVYVRGKEGELVDASGVSGEVSIENPGANPIPTEIVYRAGSGAAQSHLFAPARVSWGSVSVRLRGLPGSSEKTLTYTQSVTPSEESSSSPRDGHQGHDH